jgi:hypothetical protein
MVSTSSIKVFLVGVTASAITVLLTQELVQRRRRVRMDHRSSGNEGSRSRTLLSLGATTTPVLMDAPDLDQQMIHKAKAMIQK